MNPLKPGPRVSVVIPTRQSSRTLEACLSSLAGQSHPPHEVIVVDAYSGDGTREAASRHGASVILTPGGRAAARNTGLKHSSGEYVLFLDSDQLLHPGVIEDCVHACSSRGVEAVKIPERFVGHSSWARCSALWKNRMVKAWGRGGGIPRFYRRDTLIQAGGYDDGLRFWEDMELYQRLRSRGIREAWCAKPVTHQEASSPSELVRKYTSYGKSIPRLGRRRVKAPLTSTIRLSISTLAEALREPGDSPRLLLGCLLLTAVKGLSLGLGMLTEAARG